MFFKLARALLPAFGDHLISWAPRELSHSGGRRLGPRAVRKYPFFQLLVLVEVTVTVDVERLADVVTERTAVVVFVVETVETVPGPLGARFCPRSGVHDEGEVPPFFDPDAGVSRKFRMLRSRADGDADQPAAACQCGDSVPGFVVRRQILLVGLGHRCIHRTTAVPFLRPPRRRSLT